MKIIESLPPERWLEYKTIILNSITKEPLAFHDSLDKLQNKTDEEWQKELTEADQNKSIFVCIEDDNNEIIACAGAHVHKNPRLSHNAFFANLYVDVKFRNQGLGTKLIEKRIEILKKKYPEVTNVHCEIVTTQTSSIKIHKKLGFTVSGEIKDLFKVNGVFYSEYWMQKDIS